MAGLAGVKIKFETASVLRQRRGLRVENVAKRARCNAVGQGQGKGSLFRGKIGRQQPVPAVWQSAERGHAAGRAAEHSQQSAPGQSRLLAGTQQAADCM